MLVCLICICIWLYLYLFGSIDLFQINLCCVVLLVMVRSSTSLDQKNSKNFWICIMHSYYTGGSLLFAVSTRMWNICFIIYSFPAKKCFDWKEPDLPFWEELIRDDIRWTYKMRALQVHLVSLLLRKRSEPRFQVNLAF